MALIVGTDRNDYLVGGPEADTLQGLAGNDTLLGAGGNDLLEGGTGDDWLDGGEGWNWLRGFDGNDTLLAGTGGGTQDGDAGDDLLVGGTGSDYLQGGAGNDTLIGGGGGLPDSAAYVFRAATRGVVFDGSAVGTLAVVNLADGLGGTDRLEGIEGLSVYGSNHADTLRGGGINCLIFAGAGDDLLVGGPGDDDLRGEEGNDTLIGGSGSDWAHYDFWGAASGVVLDGSAVGTLAVVNLVDGLGGADRLESIERLWVYGSDHADSLTGGAADDVLYGLDGDDTLVGGAGNDALDGHRGNDTLDGGDGNDVLEGREGNDRLVGGAGTDTAGYDLSSVPSRVHLDFSGIGAQAVVDVADGLGGTDRLDGIELVHIQGSNYSDTLVGGPGADTIRGGPSTGLSGNDWLRGGGGNDALWGSTGSDRLEGGADNDVLLGFAGNDTLDGGPGAEWTYGGPGNDVYFVDNPGDLVDEVYEVGSGIDTVFSSISYTLRTNVEHLGLTGTDAISGAGNELDNRITGNAAANLLRGEAGADTLLGGSGADTLNGGSGADRMEGGFGGDVYVVDEPGDVVVELAGQGNDRVSTALSYALPANVESLTLAGTSDVDGTGNELANLLQGNPGHNRLSGGTGKDTLTGGLGKDTLDGGTGADWMVGQEGDDTYVVDDAGDRTIESYPNFGIDTVVSSLSRTLSTNVEHLALVGVAVTGAGNVLANRITGNELANTLLGVEGDDTLIGGAGNDTLNGGTGADRMEGGAGDDIYAVDHWSDVVVELYGEGTDRVSSTISWMLGANQENLTLAGAGSISGTGNELPNVITGNAAANALDGGASDDHLWGGSGDDTLTGGGDTDWLWGGDGNDMINGGEGRDALYASDGDDTLTGGAGNDSIHGDDGSDTVAFSGNFSDYSIDYNPWIDRFTMVDLVAGRDGSDTADGVEFLQFADGTRTKASVINDPRLIVGTAGNDLLYGGEGSDTLQGLAGNDTLYGHGGDDLLIGGAGDDYISGDAGTNTVAFTGKLAEYTISYVAGGPSYFRFTVTDSMGGRDGTDTADFVANLLFADATIPAESITSVPVVRVGTDGNDYLAGGGGDDTLQGLAGLDTLSGYDGNDLLEGGDDGDLLRGGYGDDVLLGGLDNDWLIGGRGSDTLNGGDGDDTAEYGFEGELSGVVFDGSTSGTSAVVDIGDGMGGIDRLDSIESLWVYGSNGADRLTGGAGNDVFFGDDIMAHGGSDDTICGGDGNDHVRGLIGNDWLEGGAGNDTMDGFDGNDTLEGGPGNDTLWSGAGADDFRFVSTSDGTDTITDFGSGSDKVVIVAANFGLVAGSVANLFVDADPTSGAAAFIYNSASGSLAFDADGNGPLAATPLALLSNKPATLLPGDFVIGP